jgi:Caspase domain
MRRWFPCLHLTLLLTLCPLAWNGEAAVTAEDTKPHRVAIVIGNASYSKSLLLNPRNDAVAVARRLRDHHFEVSEFHDLRSSQLPELHRLIRDKVGRHTTFVFFYAGHGMQVDGVNYLPNPDARLNDLESIRAGSIQVNELLAEVHAVRPRAAVVILDACRDNPLGDRAGHKDASKGLARAVAPAGTVIFYATRPGSTASDGAGDNGLFTEQLLKEMSQAQLPLELVFRRVSNAVYKASRGEQEPWVEGVVREEIILAQGEAAPAPVGMTDPVPSLTSGLPPTGNTLTASLASALPPVAPASPIELPQALAALRTLDLAAESLPTRYLCAQGRCEPYEPAFRRMRGEGQLPQMPTNLKSVRLCEFDLAGGSCKDDFLSHGTGISPVAMFAKMFGSSVNTRSLSLSAVQNSNGGGLVFSADPQVHIVRSRLGTSNEIACNLGDGRMEMVGDRIELVLAQNVCMQATPPVPWQYKLSFDVLLMDMSTMQAYVRWKQRGVSFGLYMASEGLARLSFE